MIFPHWSWTCSSRCTNSILNQHPTWVVFIKWRGGKKNAQVRSKLFKNINSTVENRSGVKEKVGSAYYRHFNCIPSRDTWHLRLRRQLFRTHAEGTLCTHGIDLLMTDLHICTFTNGSLIRNWLKVILASGLLSHIKPQYQPQANHIAQTKLIVRPGLFVCLFLINNPRISAKGEQSTKVDAGSFVWAHLGTKHKRILKLKTKEGHLLSKN